MAELTTVRYEVIYDFEIHKDGKKRTFITRRDMDLETAIKYIKSKENYSDYSNCRILETKTVSKEISLEEAITLRVLGGKIDMIKEKSWEEFRNSGLLWFINTTLHAFGWAIVFEVDKNKQYTRVFPARVKFRGFDENTNSEGYKKISRYMERNSKELLKESQK